MMQKYIDEINSASEVHLESSLGDLGFNENLSVGEREFHIQTATLIDEGVIRTEVFERGRLLFVQTHRYERRRTGEEQGAELRLRQEVDQFHQTIIEELDNLFEMSERVFKEDSAVAHEKIARVFLSMHIFDRAERHFKRSMELEPDRFSSYVYLSRCYYLQKRYQQAFETLSRVIEKQIRYPDVYNLMGLIMMEKRQYRQALHHFKEALKYNPGYIEAYFNLSIAILHRIIHQKGERKEQEIKKSINFIKIILKKIDNYGKVDDREQSRLINKALNKADIPKAMSLMQEYRERKFIRHTPPEVIGFKFYLRLLYGEKEMPSEVLNSFEESMSAALQENPSYPDLWQYLALIHLMQCRHYFLKGLDNFRDATRVDPEFEKAAKNLRLVENDGREFLSLIKAIV